MPALPSNGFFNHCPSPSNKELGRHREEGMENGVKNLKGARLFTKTFSNHGFRDASILSWLFIRLSDSIFFGKNKD